jgi:glycosyltransferase involved in cell wall biosynthesis
MPIVSVLVPAFRATTTIRDAIESTLACELGAAGDVQVVVAPDDESVEYASMFKGLESVHVLEPTSRLGPGRARNRAAAAAVGAWITMVDADDAVSPGYLDDLLRLARATGASCVFSRTRYEEEGHLVRELAPAAALETSSMAAFAGSIRALYRRDLWIDYPDMLAEDVFVEASLLNAVGGSAPLSNAVYLCRLRPQGICATTPQESFNAAYRQILAAAPNPVVTDVFAAKLTMGILYAKHMQRGGALSFHQFVAAATAL